MPRDARSSEAAVGPKAESFALVPLGEVATINLGRTPSRDSSTYWSPGSVPWVSIGDLTGSVVTDTKERISQKAHAEIFGGRLVPSGTLLLSFKLTIGKVGILGVPAQHNEAIASLVVDSSKIDRDFLSYQLQGFDYAPYLDRYVKGKTLNKEKLTRLLVTLPPLAEQRRIAALLTTGQRAREAGQRSINAARQLRESVSQYLFAVGQVPIESARDVPLADTELGAIPTNWTVAKFGDVVEIKQGQVSPKVDPYSAMLHIGPEDVESGTGRILAPKTAAALGLISGKYLFTPDDVVYSKIRPYLRKAALPSFTGICSADMYPVRPASRRLTREFLFYYLLSDQFTAQAVSLQDRTGIPKINREQLASLFVPIPPLKEQLAISQTLAAIDAKFAAAMKGYLAIATAFNALLRDLMPAKAANHG